MLLIEMIGYINANNIKKDEIIFFGIDRNGNWNVVFASDDRDLIEPNYFPETLIY